MTSHQEISFPVKLIGYVHSPYKQKFGIARQAGLVPSAKIEIVLLPEFTADCVRGLDEYDYVWIQFVFHKTVAEGWHPLIRPPKLGGREKRGVFATRSPHRPNHLGLSLLCLDAVHTEGQEVRLSLSGADLLDGTPVVDIKPYLAFVEAKSDAKSSFAHERRLFSIQWSAQAKHDVSLLALDNDFVRLVEESLEQDPRPSHQVRKYADKPYVFFVDRFDVVFALMADSVFEITTVRLHVE